MTQHKRPFTTVRPRHLYIWTRLDPSDYVSLREKLFSAPPMCGLRTSTFFDPSTDDLLIELSFDEDKARFDAVHQWARRNELTVVPVDDWTADRQQRFAAELRPFLCTNRRVHGPLLRVIGDFLHRARQVPSGSVEIAIEYQREIREHPIAPTPRSRVARASPAPIPAQDDSPIPMSVALGNYLLAETFEHGVIDVVHRVDSAPDVDPQSLRGDDPED